MKNPIPYIKSYFLLLSCMVCRYCVKNRRVWVLFKACFCLVLWGSLSIFPVKVQSGLKGPLEKNSSVKQQPDLAEVLAKLPKPQKTNNQKNNICKSRPGMAPEMVIIPAGSFVMGSPNTEKYHRDNESPQHKVHIQQPFMIGRCEVTFADYDLYAKATGKELPDDEGWGRGNRPVINVSWNDAQDYLQWLSEATGRRYRLPTEAEWEYVARAGSKTAYFWGDNIGNDHAVCEECGSRWDNSQTAPVASFEANALGLYDTAGNVWEWVQDCWHDNYNNAPTNGSAWEVSDNGDCGRRVLRGGSWGYDAGGMRSASRGGLRPDERGTLGFRLAQDLN